MGIIVLMLLSFLIASCDKTKKNKTSASNKTHIIVATQKSPVQKLYFTGTLLPISTTAVISNVAGIITEMDFNYGEKIQSGQKLMVLDSKPLAEKYKKAVNDFLQKKQAYANGKLSFTGTKALYAAGVIPQSQYISEQTAFDNTSLDFLEARYELEKVLRTAGVDVKKIEQLSISDTAEVNSVLQVHFKNIVIVATGSGVALFPPPNQGGGGNDASSGVLTQGTTVKEDQLLLSIGDLSGLKADFNVSEINIDRIHKGMDVIATGSAFPGIVLHGKITSVSAQAKQDSSGSGLSVYAVEIKIPVVSEADMQKIRVGMTAKFEIDIPSPSEIMLPINAVSRSDNGSVVTIVGANGKPTTVSVQTGETTATEVSITQGIKAGDKVIVTDGATP